MALAPDYILTTLQIDDCSRGKHPQMRANIGSTLRASALALSVVLASCAGLRAGSDYYAEADFGGYQTFAWVDESPLIRPQSSRVEISPLTIRRIREAVENELRAKGFELTDRQTADFAVSFTVGARDLLAVTDYPPFYRGRWNWRAPYYGASVDVQTYTEGTLAVDVFDNETRQPVWHGWARKRITGSDVDDPIHVAQRWSIASGRSSGIPHWRR